MRMRALDKLMSRIEQSKKLDGVGDALAKVAKPLPSTGMVRDVLSGTFLGHPLHPLMVTVPIGSWVSASVLDATRNTDAAQRLVGLGVVSAAPTALAGISDWQYTEGAERRVGVAHWLCNSAAVATYGMSWMLRRKGRHTTGALVSLVGSGFVGAGGYLGGHLTYARGVGVDTTAFESGPTGWTSVADASDISDNLHRVDVDGVALLVTRVDGELTAIEDRCTHRGGPLHEGKREGACVRCPWHESVFSLADGSVKQGPATRPQPAYDVREHDGAVQVKRREEGSLRRYPV
jgi:nitrite reductase/ring-hydroxylating ferredoxin subunit/uncharacterized membrane protein